MWTRRPRPGRLRAVSAGAAIVLLLALVGSPTSAGLPAAGGTIAYIRDRTELRLVEADGSHDRLIYQVPQNTVYGIEEVAWRPDGKQLAFASGHEALCSAWQYDVYLIDPDGSNLERLTNAPACSDLTGLPTGSMSITIDNLIEDISPFFVYVQGAPVAQLVTLEAGFRQTITIDGVGDLGPGIPQYVVAFNGSQRWFSAGASADVTPGGTADAGSLELSGTGADTWGAVSVSWSPDGSRLGFQLGQGALWQVPAEAATLEQGTTLLASDVNLAVSGTDLTWSPTDDRVLYTRFDQDPSTIDVATADGTDAGADLANVTLTKGIAWLPDGSGFVVSDSTDLLDGADLYLYEFAGPTVTKLTTGPGYAIWPSVAPDGQHLVYGYSTVPLDQATSVELHIRTLDGTDDHVLVDNGLNPAWH